MTTEANRHLRESARYGAYPSSPTPRTDSNGLFRGSPRPGPDPRVLARLSEDDPQVGAPAAPATRLLPIERPVARATKRLLDLLIGIPLFLFFLLLYPVVAVLLKISSPGPVLFTQTRVGRGGEPFAMHKFRSMHTDAEARLEADPELLEIYLKNGFKVPAAVDPRITRVGRWLRKASLDELPQAICILRGTMSVVGPRPVVAEQVVALYGDAPETYIACKPGLTGLWQISGRAKVLDENRARLDAAYVNEWSIRGDLHILMRTVPVVLSARGAH